MQKQITDGAALSVRPWGTLAAITLGRVAFGYQVQTVASLGPDLIAAFAIPLSVLGTLIGLYMLPGIALALPTGFLARRFGDRDVVAIGFALMAIGSLVSAVSGSVIGIGAGRMIAGAGAVALTVMQGKIIADSFAGRWFTPAMSLIVGAFPIGVGLGQLTHGPLARDFGWPAAFLAGGAVAGATLLLFLATWRAPPHAADGRTMTWPSRREMGLVVVAGLTWTFYNAGFFNFLAFMPTYLAAHGHSRAVADLVVSIATWGALPAIVAGGTLATAFGPNRVFMVGAVLSTVSVAGLGLLDWPIVWGTLFGTLASVHAGIIVAVGTMSTRPQHRAVGMAIFYTTYYVGGTIIPAICGHAADVYGDPAGAFLCAAAFSALTIPSYWLHQRMQAT